MAPEILGGDALYLEGEELRIIELGHTDTADSTALYVPSIGLVVSGDAVYNNTHPYLAECDEKTRNEWLRALDKIEALHPKAVIAGHGVLDPDSSPHHIEEKSWFPNLSFNVGGHYPRQRRHGLVLPQVQ